MEPILKQTWVISAVLVNMFGQGMVLSYPSVLLPALFLPDSPIKVDLNTASWIGSVVGLAGMPASLVSSILMDVYGRRATHAFTILPGMIGWLIIFFAKDVTSLIIGRMLCGMSAAATVHLGAVVIGEYSCPKYRGVFLYLKNTVVYVAALINHVASHFLHWKTVAMIAIVPNFIALLIIYTWPESPAWLASQQRYELSEKEFYWLRGRSQSSTRELKELIRAQMNRSSRTIKTFFLQKIIVCLNKFTKKDFLKPLAIVLLASIVLEVSGRHLFPAYAIQIIGDLTGEKSQTFYYTLALDLIIIASTIFSSVLVKILNRRTLFFSTGFAAFAVLMVICTYLLLSARGVVPNDKSWVPVVLLILYLIFANLGCAPIPLALVGEVFPLAHRGLGAAISSVWLSLCLMVGLKATPHLMASIHVYGTFFVYGMIMASCLILLYLMMPETKDRTLQEIEDYFKYGKFKKDESQCDPEEANAKMIEEEQIS